MKSTEQIERLLRKLELEPNGEKRKRTRRDLMEAQARRRENKTPVSRRGVFRRAMMTIRARRIAATVALALLLFAALGVGTGSVALSQTQHAVSATLAWLKSMIVGGEAEIPPALSPAGGATGEQTPNPDRRPVTCATRFFKVSQEEQGLWQSLRDQGIELVGVSTDPEVYYAALSPEQAQSFDASMTLKCLSAPRVTVLDGESAAIAIKDMTLQGPHGLAVAWLPTISSDGKEIQSTVSFHDGRNGFEIPNVSTESGGTVLIRACGIFPPLNQDGGDPGEVLIRLQMDIQ
jgi:hypothetical protein